jgi:hypothetical protein
MDVLRRRHTGRLRQRHRANRPDSDRLAAIVAATPALRERAVSKEARLVGTITDLLIGRGASADEAALVARTAWGVLAHAIGAWRAAPGTPLQQHVDRGFTLLSGLVSA